MNQYFKICGQLLLSFVLIISSFSCSPMDTLTKHMNTEKYTPNRFQSQNIRTEGFHKIFIDSIRILDKSYTKLPQIKELGRVIVPLLAVNVVNHSVYCAFGESMVTEPITKTAYEMTRYYLNDFSDYTISNDTNSEYRLQITIDSLSASGIYKKNSVFIFLPPFIGSVHSNKKVKDDQYNVKITYKLFQNKKQILHKTISNRGYLIQEPKIAQQIKTCEDQQGFLATCNRKCNV